MASFRAIHGGGTDKLDRNTETVETDSTKAGDVMTAGSMAATGAMIGSIGGSGTGAGIGAGVGAAVGLATVLFTRGHDLVLEPGTQFELELRQPLKFVYGEVDFSMGQINSARPGPPRAKSNNPSRPRSWMPPFFGIPIPRP